MHYEIAPDIYHPGKNARFALGKKGKKPLIVFGVNPSTADDLTPDRTINRVIGFAKDFGCDGWIMLNLCSQRTSDPKHLDNSLDSELHNKNLAEVSEIIQSNPSAVVCAAWGSPIKVRRYLKDCLSKIRHVKESDWKTLGSLTKDGHPRHPSRLTKNIHLQDFDIDTYLKNLN